MGYRTQALAAIEALADDELVLPIQTLGELFVVLTRKAGRTPADAAELVVADRLSSWDAVIVPPGTRSSSPRPQPRVPARC